MNKQREFYLEWKEFQNTTIWHVQGEGSSEQHEILHVVEYSALQEALDKLNYLQNAIQNFNERRDMERRDME